MRIFKSKNFGKTKVTALLLDDSSTKYLWVAFADNGTGFCHVQKVSAKDLNQLYFEVINLDCDNINDMVDYSSYVYLAVDDPIYFAYRLYKLSPISTQSSIEYPQGVDEPAIRVVSDGSSLYFLTPGNISGEVAKIVKMSTSLVLQEVIPLQKSGEEITNAVGLTIEGDLSSGGSLWVVTGDNPSKLIRVYEASGGIMDFDVTDLI